MCKLIAVIVHSYTYKTMRCKDFNEKYCVFL